MVFVDPYMML